MSEDKTAELALNFGSNEEDGLKEVAAARAELASDLTLDTPAEAPAPAEDVMPGAEPAVAENMTSAPAPAVFAAGTAQPAAEAAAPGNEPFIIRSRHPANRPAGTQPLKEEHIDNHSVSADAAIEGKSFGEALRILRQQHNLDYKALEKETLIQPRFLEALEKENLSAMPIVYVIAYIRTLGRFYKLSDASSSRLVAELKEQMEYSCNDELIGSVKVDTSGEAVNEQRLRKFMLAGLAGIVLLVVLISGGIYLALRKPAPEVPATVEEAGQNAPEVVFDRNTIYPLLEPPTLELPKLPVAE